MQVPLIVAKKNKMIV